MLSCKDVTVLVSQSLDDTLPLRQRMAVRLHLLLCRACTRYRRQLLFLREVMRRFPGDEPASPPPSAPALPVAARERIRRAVDTELGKSSLEERD